jgi:hypothetical protein
LVALWQGAETLPPTDSADALPSRRIRGLQTRVHNMIVRLTAFAAVLLLVLVSVLSLAGCGASAASVAGTYELDKEAVKAAARAEIETQKDSEEQDEMAEFGNVMMLGMIDSMAMTLTLNADGTAQIVTRMMGNADTARGTWKLDGKTITISAAAEGEELTAMKGTVDGDTITMQPDDEDMPFAPVFKKKA